MQTRVRRQGLLASRSSKLALLCAIIVAQLQLVAACDPTGDEDLALQLESRQSAIVNGKLESGYPEVGKLSHDLSNGSTSMCTATLIGSRTFLTAAHCLLAGATSIKLEINGTTYEVEREIQHPQYDTKTSGWGTNNDLAVGFLASPVPDVRPVKLATTAPVRGEQVTLVGFGATYEDKETAETYWTGTKRSAENTIADVGPLSIYIKGASGAVGNTCRGDSGGPTFRKENGVEVQAAISSTGELGCQKSYKVRVDAYHDWIRQQAGADFGITGEDEAPTITIQLPAPNAKTGLDLDVVAEAVEEINKVDRVSISLDGKEVQVALPEESSKHVLTVRHALSKLAAGPHRLTVEAWDTAGNRRVEETTFTAIGEGTLGGECQSNFDCASELCAGNDLSGAGYCTEACGSQSACPTGYTCSTASGKALCALEGAEAGGCAVGGGSAGMPVVPVLFLALLALTQTARRRSRHTRRRLITRSARSVERS